MWYQLCNNSGHRTRCVTLQSLIQGSIRLEHSSGSACKQRIALKLPSGNTYGSFGDEALDKFWWNQICSTVIFPYHTIQSLISCTVQICTYFSCVKRLELSCCGHCTVEVLRLIIITINVARWLPHGMCRWWCVRRFTSRWPSTLSSSWRSCRATTTSLPPATWSFLASSPSWLAWKRWSLALPGRGSRLVWTRWAAAGLNLPFVVAVIVVIVVVVVDDDDVVLLLLMMM